MFGGMNTEAMELPTERGKKLQNYLYIYLVVFAFITIIRMIMLSGDGFFDLIIAMFLFCGARSGDSCMMSFFVLLTFFSFYQCFSALGLSIQKGKSLFAKDSVVINLLLFTILVLYVAGYYLCYEAYKEFKAIQKEYAGQRGGGGGMLGGTPFDGTELADYTMGAVGGGNGGNNRRNNNGNGGGGGFVPFQGQGVTIG